MWNGAKMGMMESMMSKPAFIAAGSSGCHIDDTHGRHVTMRFHEMYSRRMCIDHIHRNVYTSRCVLTTCICDMYWRQVFVMCTKHVPGVETKASVVIVVVVIIVFVLVVVVY